MFWLFALLFLLVFGGALVWYVVYAVRTWNDPSTAARAPGGETRRRKRKGRSGGDASDSGGIDLAAAGYVYDGSGGGEQSAADAPSDAGGDSGGGDSGGGDFGGGGDGGGWD